jgi:hypothetical protein
MRRLFDFLRLDDIPVMSRPNHVAEYRQILLWGVVLGAVEANMVSVMASKTFGASRLLTTVIWALPVLMNVLNVGWGSLLRGRPRKQAFIVLALCAVGVIASVGLVSSAWRPWGGWAFAAQIGLTHLFMSGLITLRTTIWKVNYPTEHRARITSRLQAPQYLMTAVTTAALALTYDRLPGAYRLVYPGVALLGALSLLPLRRLRMRREPAELRRVREHIDAALSGDRRLASRLWVGIKETGTILRTDRPFANYMLAQFLLGAANFYTDPLLVNALTKDLQFDYFDSTAIMYLIPTVLQLLSIRYWGPVFDRLGVLRFRVYNSACWLLSYVFVAVGMLIIAAAGPGTLVFALPIVIAGRVLKGLGHGGGIIAWHLGHLQFAREHQTELYMSIHVGLTGVRALIMPLLGWAGRETFGYSALFFAVALALISHLMFRRLASQGARPDPHRSEQRSR